MLQGDDAKESSSEPPKDNLTQEVSSMSISDDMSEASSTPPMCQPLPSGKIMNLPDSECDIKSIADTHFTGHTGHQMDDMPDFDDLDEVIEYKGDSLFIALEMNDAKAVQRIIDDVSTDVNMVDEQGKTALILSSESGSTDIVNRLLNHQKTDINKRDQNGKSALNSAIDCGNSGAVRLLLESEKTTTRDVNYAMYHASCLSKFEIVDCALAQPHVNINWASSPSGMTALFAACQAGSLEIVEKLLEQTAIEVNKASTTGAAPLYMACQNGHLEIVEKLLGQNETNVNQTLADGWTALHAACSERNLEIVAKLLERNEIEVDKRDNDGWTPLCVASYHGQVHNIKYLLTSSRANINIRTTAADGNIKAGSTALMIAVHCGHQDVVQELLGHANIEVNQKDESGASAFSIAEREGHDELANLLRNRSN